MGAEKTKEPRPLRYVREQGTIVSRQPAIEGAVAHAFERMQEPERHDLTRPQGRVGMFGNVLHVRIDLTE